MENCWLTFAIGRGRGKNWKKIELSKESFSRKFLSWHFEKNCILFSTEKPVYTFFLTESSNLLGSYPILQFLTALLGASLFPLSSTCPRRARQAFPISSKLSSAFATLFFSILKVFFLVFFFAQRRVLSRAEPNIRKKLSTSPNGFTTFRPLSIRWNFWTFLNFVNYWSFNHLLPSYASTLSILWLFQFDNIGFLFSRSV